MPRSRGLVVGLCLVVLGIWGAIIPFVGPYFHYAFINLQRWHFIYGRLWLDIIPGAATFFAGLLLFPVFDPVPQLTGSAPLAPRGEEEDD